METFFLRLYFGDDIHKPHSVADFFVFFTGLQPWNLTGEKVKIKFLSHGNSLVK